MFPDNQNCIYPVCGLAGGQYTAESKLEEISAYETGSRQRASICKPPRLLNLVRSTTAQGASVYVASALHLLPAFHLLHEVVRVGRETRPNAMDHTSPRLRPGVTNNVTVLPHIR